MKKSILFATLMCCFVSLVAQQTYSDPEILRIKQLNWYNNSYTVKLDSITDGYSRRLFEYDDRFRCTLQSVYTYGSIDTIGWFLRSTREYTYDDLDRVILIRSYDDGAVKKTEYIYNEQSLLSEAIQSYFNGTNWHFQYKYNYEYDGEGNLTLYIQYEYDEDHWAEKEKKVWEYEVGLPQSMLRYVVSYAYEKTLYSYNAQGLCSEKALCYRNTEPGWTEMWGSPYFKECYEYDDAGNLLTKTNLQVRSNSTEWYYLRKTEMTYDENNNCTYIGVYKVYDYDTEQWTFVSNALDFTYDCTISIDNISGFSLFWEHWLDDLDLSVPIFYEMQHITFDNLGQIIEWNFYYSNFNGLEETTDGGFAIFPNPTNGVLVVETMCTPSLPTQTYRITNLMGQTLMSGTITAETQQIDVSKLSQGMYFITVCGKTLKFLAQ